MEKCDKCGFEAKNINGLRLHSKKHKDELKEELKEIPQVAEMIEEQGCPVRIKLFDGANKLIISYPVIGNEAVENAVKHAENKGYRIEIER